MNYYDEVNSAIDAVENAYDTYVLIWILVVFVFAVAVGIILFLSFHADKKRALHQKKINDDVVLKIKEVNFTPTRTFYFCDKTTYKKTDDYKQMLLVDSNNSKLGLIDYENGEFTAIDYSQILNYELYENGTLQLNGGAIGGLGIGGFSAQTNPICKELRLIIRMNSVDKPHVAYQIVASKGIFNLGIGKNSVIYRTCFPTVQEVISLLQVILQQNKDSEK